MIFDKKVYQWVNIGLISSLILMFIVANFSIITISCPYKSNGSNCISCGSTRMLQAFLKGHWEIKEEQFTIFKIVIFFIIQFFLRLFSLFANTKFNSIRTVIFFDLTLSSSLFLYCFWDVIWK